MIFSVTGRTGRLLSRPSLGGARQSLSYADALVTAERVAGGLAALGVGRGDRVGIFAHNGLDYLAAMFGAWRLGAICALVNLQYAD